MEMSAKEMAAHLRIHYMTLTKLAREGKIPSKRGRTTGKSNFVFDLEEVERKLWGHQAH